MYLCCMQNGDTALHRACSRRDYNTVDLLMKDGVNVDNVNNVSLWYDNVYHLINFFTEKNKKACNILYK